jgi:acyl carrier protein
MGLDTVEIIVDIENSFNIHIEDEDAARIRTVGELIDHVWFLVKKEESNSCLNQIIFFRLRKFFTSKDFISNQKFTPSLKINQLIIKEEKEQLVKSLENELNLAVPNISNYWIITSENIRFTDTIQDLINRLIFDNIHSLVKETAISRTTVAGVIKYVLQEVSGLEIKNIPENASIVNDLGIS